MCNSTSAHEKALLISGLQKNPSIHPSKSLSLKDLPPAPDNATPKPPSVASFSKKQLGIDPRVEVVRAVKLQNKYIKYMDFFACTVLLWAFLVHKMILLKGGWPLGCGNCALPKVQDDGWRWSKPICLAYPLPPVHGCEVWHQLGSCSRVGYLAGTTKIRVYNCTLGTLQQMYSYVKITYTHSHALLGSWYLSHNICDTKSRNMFFTNNDIAQIQNVSKCEFAPHFMILLFWGYVSIEGPFQNLVGKTAS